MSIKGLSENSKIQSKRRTMTTKLSIFEDNLTQLFFAYRRTNRRHNRRHFKAYSPTLKRFLA